MGQFKLNNEPLGFIHGYWGLTTGTMGTLVAEYPHEQAASYLTALTDGLFGLLAEYPHEQAPSYLTALTDLESYVGNRHLPT